MATDLNQCSPVLSVLERTWLHLQYTRSSGLSQSIWLWWGALCRILWEITESITDDQRKCQYSTQNQVKIPLFLPGRNMNSRLHVPVLGVETHQRACVPPDCEGVLTILRNVWTKEGGVWAPGRDLLRNLLELQSVFVSMSWSDCWMTRCLDAVQISTQMLSHHPGSTTRGCYVGYVMLY